MNSEAVECPFAVIVDEIPGGTFAVRVEFAATFVLREDAEIIARRVAAKLGAIGWTVPPRFTAPRPPLNAPNEAGDAA